MSIQLEHEYLKLRLLEAQMQVLQYQHKEVTLEIKRLEAQPKSNITNHESVPEIHF